MVALPVSAHTTCAPSVASLATLPVVGGLATVYDAHVMAEHIAPLQPCPHAPQFNAELVRSSQTPPAHMVRPASHPLGPSEGLSPPASGWTPPSPASCRLAESCGLPESGGEDEASPASATEASLPESIPKS